MRRLPLALCLLIALPASASASAYTDMSVEDVCKRIANKLASVSYAECDTGLKKTGAESVRGIPIVIKEYPPLLGRIPQARILVVGGIHGDEYSSVSVIFKWMKTLDRYHSGLFHWKIAPLMNPDGLLRRKSQRMNENGVDLNRNFPTSNWQAESRHYWVNRTKRNPRRYPGKAPLSEPESLWLYELVEEFKPDAIVAVHAPYGVLDFDGPDRPPKRIGYLHLNLLGAYPGSLGNYAGIENEIPVITLELPHAGIMPSKKQISHIWVDLVRWLKKNTPRKLQFARPVTPPLASPELPAQAGPS